MEVKQQVQILPNTNRESKIVYNIYQQPNGSQINFAPVQGSTNLMKTNTHVKFCLYFIFKNTRRGDHWKFLKFSLKLTTPTCTVSQQRSAWGYLLWYLIFNNDKSALPLVDMGVHMKKIYFDKFKSCLTANSIFPDLSSLTLLDSDTVIQGYDTTDPNAGQYSIIEQFVIDVKPKQFTLGPKASDQNIVMNVPVHNLKSKSVAQVLSFPKVDAVGNQDDNVINLDDYPEQGFTVQEYVKTGNSSLSANPSAGIVAVPHVQPQSETVTEPIEALDLSKKASLPVLSKKPGNRKKKKSANLGPTITKMEYAHHKGPNFKTLVVKGTEDMIILDDSQSVQQTGKATVSSRLQSQTSAVPEGDEWKPVINIDPLHVQNASNFTVNQVVSQQPAAHKSLFDSSLKTEPGSVLQSDVNTHTSENSTLNATQKIEPADKDMYQAKYVSLLGQSRKILPKPSSQNINNGATDTSPVKTFILKRPLVGKGSDSPTGKVIKFDTNTERDMQVGQGSPRKHAPSILSGNRNKQSVIVTCIKPESDDSTKKMTGSNRWKFSKERVHVSKREVVDTTQSQHDLRIQPEPVPRKKPGRKKLRKDESVVLISDDDEEKPEVQPSGSTSSVPKEEKANKKVYTWVPMKRGVGIMPKTVMNKNGKKVYKVKSSNFFSISKKRMISLGLKGKDARAVSPSVELEDRKRALCKNMRIKDLVDSKSEKDVFLSMFSLVSNTKLESACASVSENRTSRRRHIKAPTRFDL